MASLNSDLNSDLLPPIFDEVVRDCGETAGGRELRANIVAALHNAIVGAAVDKEIKKWHRPPSVPFPPMRPPKENGTDTQETQPRQKEADTCYELRTSDRLSGATLSRSRLVEQMYVIINEIVPLPPGILETAILLVEAEIDLRLNRNRTEGFELQGIQFCVDPSIEEDIASWCKQILALSLKGSSSDRRTIWQRLSHHRPEGIRIMAEGLRLAATLRDAVPYTIKIERRLVEARLPTKHKGSSEAIRVLHISDLHFAEKMTEYGRRLHRPVGVATQDIQTAEFLSRTLLHLTPEYDLLLVTGDLTTDGARVSFQNVRQFLRGGPMSGEDPKRVALHGLSVEPERLVLVPGNHDRFEGRTVPGQHTSNLFEQVLETPQRYPYIRAYRSREDGGSLTLLFFVFDSNLDKDARKTDVAKGRAVARGRITDHDIDEAFRLAKEIKDKKKVWNLRGTELPIDLQKTVRIAVLHHHPLLSTEKEKEAQESYRFLRILRHPAKWYSHHKSQREVSLVELENADKFLRACFELGIQLIFFGHQHSPYYRAVRIKRWEGPRAKVELKTPFGKMPSVIHGFCCASTLEYTAEENGFYIFDFNDEKEVLVKYYSSKKSERHSLSSFTQQTSRVIDLSDCDVSEKETKWLKAAPDTIESLQRVE